MKNTYTPQDIDEIINSRNAAEGEQLEFKEAKINFSNTDRADYCAGIANAGGGKMLLGIKNDGEIIGTAVYTGTIQKVPHEIFQTLKIHIKVEEIYRKKGRVVIFEIPPRPYATVVKSSAKYRYPIRVGESLTEISDDEFRRIINEKQVKLNIDEILELEKIRVNDGIKIVTNKDKFLDLGILEKVGQGRGTKYTISRKYYEMVDKTWKFTKIHGLPRSKNKDLILSHIEKHKKGYSKDFQLLLETGPDNVKNLLSELKKIGKIKCVGKNRHAYWVLND